MTRTGNAAAPQPTVPADLHGEVRRLIDAKDYPAARDLLMKALKENRTAEAQCGLGEVYALMGNLNEAVISFEIAIKADPECHKAYACIGELLILQNQLFHALDYYGL